MDKSQMYTSQPPQYGSAGNADASSQQYQSQHEMTQTQAQPQQQQQYPPPQQQQQQQQHPPQEQQKSAAYTSAHPVPLMNLSSNPAPVQCPNCQQRVMTSTEFQTGNTTNAWAAGLCLVACLGCIPYCITSTKDVVHKCGNCGARLATWHRSGRIEVHFH